MRIDDFKSALRSYRWVERQIVYLFHKIEEKEHELTGLAHHSTPMTPEQERSAKPMPKGIHGGRSLVDRICELDGLKDEMRGLQKVKSSIDAVLDRMEPEDREIVMLYFCDHRQADGLAECYGFSNRSSLRKRMESCIKQNCR